MLMLLRALVLTFVLLPLPSWAGTAPFSSLSRGTCPGDMEEIFITAALRDLLLDKRELLVDTNEKPASERNPFIAILELRSTLRELDENIPFKGWRDDILFQSSGIVSTEKMSKIIQVYGPRIIGMGRSFSSLHDFLRQSGHLQNREVQQYLWDVSGQIRRLLTRLRELTIDHPSFAFIYFAKSGSPHGVIARRMKDVWGEIVNQANGYAVYGVQMSVEGTMRAGNLAIIPPLQDATRKNAMTYFEWARNKKSLSRQELAQRTGLTVQNIEDLENGIGISLLTFEQIQKVANALELKVVITFELSNIIFPDQPRILEREDYKGMMTPLLWARLRKNMSQQTLAELSGVPIEAIQEFEKSQGLTLTNLERLWLVARYLDHTMRINFYYDPQRP